MAIEDDVLVVGGGLAGVTAALAAAREGARVRLLSKKESSLRLASGLVDALGVVDGAFVADPYDAIEGLPETHPYRILGADTLREGLALFDSVAEYRGGHTDANALVPTHVGSVKPTARYPDSVASGLASRDEKTLLVGFEAEPDLDAPLAAAHLERAGVPFDVSGATVAFPGDLRDDAKVTRFAKLLDEEPSVRRELAERVKPHLDGAARVGFPAVLGQDHASEVRAALESHLGATVFEIPMGPPSLLGLRLQERLYEALDAEGVAVETGNPVVDFDAAEGEIEQVVAEHTHTRVPYAASQYVLATGGLVGKGIDSTREVVREPVFGCHVAHPENRYEWFADGAYGDHPFARFGVGIDADARPLDGEGEVEYENLRAAGGVVGGADIAAEKSGSGVSLATGYVAGQRAGELI
ncbi:glycerol-3-phosphate dehydrogenase subunit GlpB [Natronomonas sp. EA1]|uniref:glycerol-3-phosphate dehydrogenase subunit GlpB n=1 Tax=Natronomonas sp. EA1 TaxID=3421655 RepID=UPI003EBB1C41